MEMDLFTIIILVSCVEYVALAIMLWYYSWHLPRQPYALILRRAQNGYLLIQKVILNATKESFNYGTHSYIVDWNLTAFLSQKGKPVLIYVEGKGLPIRLCPKLKIDEEESSGKLHMILGKETIRQLIEATKTTLNTTNLLMLIMCLIGGFLIGLFISPYLLPSKS